MHWDKTPFGEIAGGRGVDLFTLSRSGVEVRILSYGGAVASLAVPDRSGRRADVVLGFDSLDGYAGQRSYFGVIVGRCANRIRAVASGWAASNTPSRATTATTTCTVASGTSDACSGPLGSARRPRAPPSS